MNPYLIFDLDTDNVCDEINGGTEAYCVAACHEVYIDSDKVNRCVYQCLHLDNCPCFRDGECPGKSDPDTMAAQVAYDEFCRDYKWCINLRRHLSSVGHVLVLILTVGLMVKLVAFMMAQQFLI